MHHGFDDSGLYCDCLEVSGWSQENEYQDGSKATAYIPRIVCNEMFIIIILKKCYYITQVSSLRVKWTAAPRKIQHNNMPTSLITLTSILSLGNSTDYGDYQ